MTNIHSSDQVIEELVRVAHGNSDSRSQSLYRQSLQALVGLAKAEQKRDSLLEFEARMPGVLTVALH